MSSLSHLETDTCTRCSHRLGGSCPSLAPPYLRTWSYTVYTLYFVLQVKFDCSCLTNSYCPVASSLAPFGWLQKGWNPLSEGEKWGRGQRPNPVSPSFSPLHLRCDSTQATSIKPQPPPLPPMHCWTSSLVVILGLRLQRMLVLLEFFQQTYLIVAAPWQSVSHSECFIESQEHLILPQYFLFFFLVFLLFSLEQVLFPHPPNRHISGKDWKEPASLASSPPRSSCEDALYSKL